MNNVNYIFDVVGKKNQAMRGFLDVETQEIVIYDDLKGKELFRIGGNGQSNQQVKPATKKKLTTLTFEICNGSDKKQTATLFAANLEPLIQPLGVSVKIKEIENSVFNSHNYLRRDILAQNKLKIVGFSLFVENQQQFNNNLVFGTIKPYGVIETQSFSPLNYLGKNQVDPNLMDMSKKINWNVDARSILYVPVEPKSHVTILFNVIEDVIEPMLTDYTEKAVKKRQISYDGDESNTIFKNVNSGGLGAVNFDGSSDSESSNINIKKKYTNTDLMNFGILAISAGLIINALCKSK